MPAALPVSDSEAMEKVQKEAEVEEASKMELQEAYEVKKGRSVVGHRQQAEKEVVAVGSNKSFRKVIYHAHHYRNSQAPWRLLGILYHCHCEPTSNSGSMSMSAVGSKLYGV
jgi:hypothetical protein